MALSKCDKGYCKNKDSCTQKHPQTKCNGHCEDKRLCPKRHRTLCKNGDTCVLVASELCEFLHKNSNTENQDAENSVFKSIVKTIEDKLRELSIKENETVHKIGKLEGGLCNIKDTQSLLLESLVDRVGYIEEEFSNKLEQLEKGMEDSSKQYQETIKQLEKRIEVLDTMINQPINVHEKQVPLVEYHSIPTTISDTENKGNNKPRCDNEVKCDICKKIFKSSDNLKTHDEKFHMKRIANRNPIYKCDQYTFTSTDKSEVYIHINEKHNKCDICQRIFTNSKTLETHMKAIHKKEITKNLIEREPSLKNHKINKI